MTDHGATYSIKVMPSSALKIFVHAGQRTEPRYDPGMRRVWSQSGQPSSTFPSFFSFFAVGLSSSPTSSEAASTLDGSGDSEVAGSAETGNFVEQSGQPTEPL